MKAFQGRGTNSTSLKRSRSFVGRSAGPAGRHSCARSSPCVSVPIARTNAHIGSNWSTDSLAMLAQDAVKQLAPFSARDTNDGVAEIDILGIGQAAVDLAASVEEPVLAALNVPKGGRRVITVDERAQVMELLDGYDSQVSAGGSLANTLVGLGQLAAAQQRIASLRSSSNRHPSATSSTPNPAATSSSTSTNIKVAMTGCVVGSDALGEFAAAQLEAAAVEVVPTQPPTSSATGVVMVLTTPDAQRSFLSSFSSKDRIVLTDELKATVARSQMVVVEGYMWEVEGSVEVIPAIIRHARSCGTLVALTAGDASVVERHASKVLAAIDSGIDLWFGNEAEAAALVRSIKQQQLQQGQQDLQQQVLHSVASNISNTWQHTAPVQLERADSADSSSSTMLNNQLHGSPVSQGQECALELASICPMVVVTDGSRGSYITALGQLVVVPPYWSANSPVDTCGAGDAYAAGLLYGFLTGLDLHSMGQVAAKTASAVIGRHGSQLLPEDADWVAAGMVQREGGLAAAVAGAGTNGRAANSGVSKGQWRPVNGAAATVAGGMTSTSSSSGLNNTKGLQQ